MANKQLKSIKFPGLDDTYTIPQTAEEITYNSSASSHTSGSTAAAIASHSSQIEELSTDKADKTALALTDKKLDYLAKLTKGQAWSESAGTTPAYQHTVAKGAKAVEVKKIGGKTIKYNQMVNLIAVTKTVEGVTFTNNNDGTITINGTANTQIDVAVGLFSTEKTLYTSHKYYVHNNSNGGFSVRLQGQSSAGEINQSIIRSPSNETSTNSGVIVRCISGTTYNSVVFKPWLIDLTDMFGSGNEPSTVDAFKAMFPDDFYEYNTGTLVSADVTSVVSKEDDGTTTMGTLSIPQVGTHSAFSALYPLRSAGTVYDEIDIVNKKHIKRVGTVNLGTLTWTYDETTVGTSHARFYATISEMKVADVALKSNIVTPIYETDAANRTYTHTKDKTISSDNVRRLNVYDSAYSDPTTFKTAMSGVMLYYELATPVETDISAYFTDDNLLDVEYNGTLTFTQGNKVGSTDVDIRIPVPNGTTYMINNAEATT